VIGILAGANSAGEDRAGLYSAHYDHLGFVPGTWGLAKENGGKRHLFADRW
jgi:hypothetical protein